MLIAGLVAVALVLLAQPFLMELQDTVRRFTHPLLYEETIRAAAAENGVEPALVEIQVRAVEHDRPVIIATGPLTSDTLSMDVARFVGRDHLYFYDAISPIVLAETIDRYDRKTVICISQA